MESKAHGTPVTYPVARQACSDLGGRPPTWWELDAIRQMSGIEWAAGSGSNQYEWSSTLHDIVSPPKVIALDQAGNYINGDNTNTFRYRCVLQPTDG